MSYQIITDATSDLSKDLIRDVPYISVVPMEITVNGTIESVTEAEGDSVGAFYQKMRDGAEVKTSQINMEIYKDHFRTFLTDGKDILYLCFTSGLSGTINAAHIAIDELEEEFPERTIICVDTLAASIGEGFLVREAARKQAEGLSIRALADWVEQNKQSVCQWFAVDSLTHLLKGGRMMSSMAGLGNALQIKPMLHVDENGKLKLAGNAHGKTQAMRKLSQFAANGYRTGLGSLFLIGHADCPEDAAKLKDMVLNACPDADIRVAQIGPVIGSHTGPGMTAIVYWGDNR